MPPEARQHTGSGFSKRVTLGTPGNDITVTGPVATRVLNWGFTHF